MKLGSFFQLTDRHIFKFQKVEIENLCDSDISKTPRFHTVANLAVPFYSKENQMSGGQIKPFTTGEAVKTGILYNQTLAYFIGRIFLFASKMRFRLEWEKFIFGSKL